MKQIHNNGNLTHVPICHNIREDYGLAKSVEREINAFGKVAYAVLRSEASLKSAAL